MAKVKIQGHASGTGILTVTAPNTSTDRTITLPDSTGTILDENSSLPAANLTGSIADARIPEGAVTQHLTSVNQSIATLGLHMGVADNKAAYNLPNAFIDTFEDDTGITTETNVDRTTSEYVASVYQTGASIPANTKILIHSDTTDGSTTFTDSSDSSHTISVSGDAQHDTAQKKFGATSMLFDGTGDYLSTSSTSSDFSFGTGDFTIACWVRWSTFGTDESIIQNRQSGASTAWWFGSNASSKLTFNTGAATLIAGGTTLSAGSWYHFAVTRSGTDLRLFVNGVEDATSVTNSSNFSTVQKCFIGGNDTQGANNFTGWIDEILVSKGTAVWTSGFTPPTDSYGAETANATGTLISDTQTAPSATTEVSGVMLYKDNAGTATLGTHLKIYFTADNGSNWTEASSYGTAQTFSGTTKQVKLGKTTVTSGTQVAMKAVWASQASGTMETQLHGWAVNY